MDHTTAFPLQKRKKIDEGMKKEIMAVI